MTQVGYANERMVAGVHTKRVYFTGTDVLKEGYPMIYNRRSTTGNSAGAFDIHRAYEVIKPTKAGSQDFAGLVGIWDSGKTGPCWINIVTPSEQGIVCTGYAAVATSIGTAGGTTKRTQLGITGATYALGAATATNQAIGSALVTDAGATAKPREMILNGKLRADYCAPPTGGTTGGTYAITGSTVQAPIDIKRITKVLNNVITALEKAGIMNTSGNNI